MTALAGVGCKRAPAAPLEPLVVHVERLQGEDGSSTFRATGDVHARVESNLSFQTSGKVVARLVDVGDHVAAGAVLARLDSTQQQADVSIAAATLGSASAALDRANLELERERALFAAEATTTLKLDERVRDQGTAQAAFLSAQAKVAMARETLSYTELRAARPGTISARSVEVGQVVQAGATMYTLNEGGPRDAVFRLDEKVAGRVGKATPVAVALIDDPEIQVAGVVREIAPAIDVDTSSVRIKVAIGDPPPRMSLGAPVVATLKLAATRTFTLPAAALFSDTEEEPAVWVVDAATKAVSLRRVVVDGYDSRSIIVREGLNDGDLVVTSGASRLRPAQVIHFELVGPA